MQTSKGVGNLIEANQNFLLRKLADFTDTSAYFRISRRHVLTDGTRYLAEKAECFWMMDAIASHLCEIGTEDWFVVVRMSVMEGLTTRLSE
jgi:hypothetical protein